MWCINKFDSILYVAHLGKFVDCFRLPRSGRPNERPAAERLESHCEGEERPLREGGKHQRGVRSVVFHVVRERSAYLRDAASAKFILHRDGRCPVFRVICQQKCFNL